MTCKSVYLHVRNLSRIRRFLSDDAAKLVNWWRMPSSRHVSTTPTLCFSGSARPESGVSNVWWTPQHEWSSARAGRSMSPHSCVPSTGYRLSNVFCSWRHCTVGVQVSQWACSLLHGKTFLAWAMAIILRGFVLDYPSNGYCQSKDLRYILLPCRILPSVPCRERTHGTQRLRCQWWPLRQFADAMGNMHSSIMVTTAEKLLSRTSWPVVAGVLTTRSGSGGWGALLAQLVSTCDLWTLQRTIFHWIVNAWNESWNMAVALRFPAPLQ